MGIYIPNKEKPKSCYNHCNFIAMEEVGCPLKDYTESHQYKDKIHPGCPLIEMDEEVFRHLKGCAFIIKALYKKLKGKYKCAEEDEEGIEEDFDPYQGDRDRDTFGEIY